MFLSHRGTKAEEPCEKNTETCGMDTLSSIPEGLMDLMDFQAPLLDEGRDADADPQSALLSLFVSMQSGLYFGT